MDRGASRRLDAADPLARFRARFELPPGIVYLDGNSLGPLPSQTSGRLREVLVEEWGAGLIRSWNQAGWIDAPVRIGDKIAHLVGAGPGEVVATDSTSVDLFKLLGAALLARPRRRVILTEAENFPSDLYIAQGLAALAGAQVRVLPRAQLLSGLDSDVCVLALTQVDFRTGRLLDMAGLTRAAHEAGALALWDLSHSAGALPIDLSGCEVDLAVGCGYKFLNGGPGAPAYLYVARRLQEGLRTPIQGWLGHRTPFEFAGAYEAGDGVGRFVAGTPSILAMAALESAIDLWLEVDLAEVRRKSAALGDLMIALVDERPDLGLRLHSPRAAAERGSQISLTHPEAYGIIQALIERGVIGDFRAPDNLRFGLTPLYTTYEDVHDAVEAMAGIISTGAHLDPRFRVRARVT